MAVDEQKLDEMFKTPRISKADQEIRGKIYRAGKTFARALMREGGGTNEVLSHVKSAVVLAVDASQRG